MKIAVKDIKGNDTGRSVDLPKEVFVIEPNNHAIYLDVKQYLANQRQGTHKAKEKAEITGSTRKIKKQKGTGTARAGSIKSGVFRGGGRFFGPRPRNYGFKLNKNTKRLARKSALSLKASEKAIVVIEDFKMDTPKNTEDNIQKYIVDDTVEFQYGLKCPPNVKAAGFYNSLLEIDQPAVVIEPLNGYRTKEQLPLNYGEFKTPIGEIEILKEGKDITSKMKLFLLNNHMDYINEIIMPKLTDDNSLFLFMKLGEGNIVQLFKNEEYNAYDIIFFLDYIKKYQKQFTNINIQKTNIT